MDGLLAGIKGFNKNNLKDVETVERTTPSVPDKPKGKFRYNFGHDDEEEKIEWFDEPEEFRSKCSSLAKLIKEAKSVVIYTGAGISTSAKLPDYRGSDGMWTNRDAGTTQDKTKYVSTISMAIPTLAHMSVSELVKREMVAAVVSTNVDGLHMRSGVPMSKLSELHGNSYLEVCNKCHEKYLRSQDILQHQNADHRAVNRHWCGAKCEKAGCDGLLLDTIIAFGENLPLDQLEQATSHSQKGDLAIVLGSTMMVQPACLLPEYIYKKKHGKMVICNLQKTQFDPCAEFVIRGHTDDVFYLVMQQLGIEVPMNIPETQLRVPDYIDEITTKHLQKIEENKKKLQQIQEDKKSTPVGNALTRGENMYSRNVVSIDCKTQDLNFSNIELVFFNGCQGQNHVLQSKTKKVVISDCHNTVIRIQGKIITSTLEVINSDHVTLFLDTSVGTITCDNSDDIEMHFGESDDFQMIAWAKSRSSKLFIAEKPIDITTTEAIEYGKDQVITRKTDTGEIISKPTRRDSCGRLVS